MLNLGGPESKISSASREAGVSVGNERGRKAFGVVPPQDVVSVSAVLQLKHGRALICRKSVSDPAKSKTTATCISRRLALRHPRAEEPGLLRPARGGTAC